MIWCTRPQQPVGQKAGWHASGFIEVNATAKVPLYCVLLAGDVLYVFFSPAMAGVLWWFQAFLEKNCGYFFTKAFPTNSVGFLSYLTGRSQWSRKNGAFSFSGQWVWRWKTHSI